MARGAGALPEGWDHASVYNSSRFQKGSRDQGIFGTPPSSPPSPPLCARQALALKPKSIEPCTGPVRQQHWKARVQGRAC